MKNRIIIGRRDILSRVEAGPCHALASRGVRGLARRLALELVNLGHLKLLPARGRFEKRFVVTANGSHMLGSFDSDADLATEVWHLRRRAA